MDSTLNLPEYSLHHCDDTKIGMGWKYMQIVNINCKKNRSLNTPLQDTTKNIWKKSISKAGNGNKESMTR